MLDCFSGFYDSIYMKYNICQCLGILRKKYIICVLQYDNFVLINNFMLMYILCIRIFLLDRKKDFLILYFDESNMKVV